MQKLADVEMTWGERLRFEGKTEGEVIGKIEGEWLGKQIMLLRLMSLMFGTLPEAGLARVKTIKDDALLGTISR